MDFEDSVAYVVYKFYNSLAIHGAPLKILDSFLPLLCMIAPTFKSKMFLWFDIWFRNLSIQPSDDD